MLNALTENIHFTGSKESTAGDDNQPIKLTTLTTATTTTTTTTLKTPSSPTPPPPRTSSSVEEKTINPDNPLGIKIKEITKPEEIRITDDKPKAPLRPQIRDSSTTTSTERSNNPNIEMDDLEIMEHPVIQPELIFNGEDDAAFDSSDAAGDDFASDGDSIKIVRQTENIAKPTASMEIVTNIATTTESNGSGSQAIIDVAGQKYSVNGTENLQRGDDDEDDRKMSRKSSNTIEYFTSTTTDNDVANTSELPSSTETSFSSSSTPESTDEFSSSSTIDPCLIYLENSFGKGSSTTARQLTAEEIIAIYERGTSHGPLSTESATLSSTTARQWTDEEIIAMYESGTTHGPGGINDDEIEMNIIRQYELCMKVMMSSSTTDMSKSDVSSTLSPDESASLAARMIGSTSSTPSIVGRSPGEPELIPEWERTNSSTGVSSTILHPVQAAAASSSNNDIKDLLVMYTTAGPKDDLPAYGDEDDEEDKTNLVTAGPIGSSFELVTTGPSESNKVSNGLETFWTLQEKANDIQMGQFTDFVKTIFFKDQINVSTAGPTQ